MPGSVRVINANRGMAPDDSGPESGEVVIAVDRTHAVLGNRHILHNRRDALERERVIAAYAADLQADIAQRGPMFRAIEGIASRVAVGERICLQCWCRPLPCHADLIEREVLKQLDK
jgi:hypothetical protein